MARSIATLGDVKAAMEVMHEVALIKGERDEARRQVKELTERLANCRCSQAVIAIDPSPSGDSEVVLGRRWVDEPR